MKFNLKESNTFCVYPFIHIATLTNGTVTPCCIATGTSNNLNSMTIKQAWNSDDMKSIRLAMMSDKPVRNCNQCYIDEKSGIESHRLKSNKFYSSNYSKKLEVALESVDEFGYSNINPFTLDIRAGNTCNLKCIMCRPNESSKWLADSKLLSELSQNPILKSIWTSNSMIETSQFTWVEKQEFWEEFEILVPALQEIIFGGGEPFLSKSINNLIQYMVDTGHCEHIKIRFHTNGTQIPDSFWSLVPKFKEIELMFSIDGYDDKNYYVRYPAQWSEIEHNVNLSINSGAKTMILSSIHALNTLDIVDLYRWWMKLDYKNTIRYPIVLGRVYNPTYLNPQILPKNVKNKIEQKIQEFLLEVDGKFPDYYFTSLKSNLSWILESSNTNIESIIEYVTHLDSIRGTNFSETFSELNQLLMNNE
jgi:MoaA/NifB/PqqE/SkfB family radical SAM enzyme